MAVVPERAINITDYLGHHVSHLLASEPYKRWPYERAVDDDTDERRISYSFKENGLELLCGATEILETAFLYVTEYGGFKLPLFELPLSLTRREVRDYFGVPERTGAARVDPIFGPMGPWDRYARGNIRYHFEFLPEKDEVKMVTLMLAEVAP